MKKILTLLISLTLLFVTVSCNMDSTTGLFQEAGTSVKKASYTIHNVLYRFSDTSFLVASDEGVFVFDNGSKSGSSYGTGINAENVIYATGTASEWWCIYYDESAGKYYKIGNTIDKTEYTELSGKYLNKGMYTYEYVNGTNEQAAVFKNSSDSKYYIYYSSNNTAPTDENLISLASCSYSGVTYMGNGYFIAKESDTLYYFTSTSSRTTNSNSYITHLDGIFLSSSDTFYNGTTSIGSASGNTYRRVATSLSDGKRYFMLSGLNYAYYVNSSNELVESSVSGLSSIEVLFVAKVVDGKYINVITAQNGAQCISLEDKSILSSWK